MAQGRLIGTLSFGTKTRQHFSPEDVELMRIVTDQVAIAMQRLQAQEALRHHALELQSLNETLEQRVRERTAELADLSSQLVTAQENERRRVSYDLHDNVWQSLDIIRHQIEDLLSKQDESDRVIFRQKAKQVISLIQDAVMRIRFTQGDLWPYVLDDIGIVSTIDWYCREFGNTHSHLTIEKTNSISEFEVPAGLKIVIYRILQETLSNVEKHSQAKHVAVRFVKNDNAIELTVADNGIGFDPVETSARRTPWGGLGLLNIKARTELSGGTFEVESSRGKGATVRVSWPLQ